MRAAPRSLAKLADASQDLNQTATWHCCLRPTAGRGPIDPNARDWHATCNNGSSHVADPVGRRCPPAGVADQTTQAEQTRVPREHSQKRRSQYGDPSPLRETARCTAPRPGWPLPAKAHRVFFLAMRRPDRPLSRRDTLISRDAERIALTPSTLTEPLGTTTTPRLRRRLPRRFPPHHRSRAD